MVTRADGAGNPGAVEELEALRRNIELSAHRIREQIEKLEALLIGARTLRGHLVASLEPHRHENRLPRLDEDIHRPLFPESS